MEATNLKTMGHKSILIVDDMPLVANTIRLLLEINGHQVEVAEDAERALALYENGQYDLVITDFLMRGMNGLELARRIRERVPQQPILMISGYAQSITNSEKKRSNIDAVVGKPFSQEDLQEALINIFPGG